MKPGCPTDPAAFPGGPSKPEATIGCHFLARPDQAVAPSSRVPRLAALPQWPAQDLAPTSGLQLRRRHQRVCVRSPEVEPKPLIDPERDRRARTPTLTGLGTREAQPTMPDWTTPPPPPVRPRVDAICDLDEDESDRLRREAARLSLSFEWDIE